MKSYCTTEEEQWARVPSITRNVPPLYPLASQDRNTPITAVFFLLMLYWLLIHKGDPRKAGAFTPLALRQGKKGGERSDILWTADGRYHFDFITYTSGSKRLFHSEMHLEST